MKSQKILSVLSLIAITTLSRGSVIFQNDGTISPWGHTLKDSGASLTEVSSPTFKGSSAIKHFANYSGSGDNSIHCEVARDPAASNGDNRYYGWAFRLGSDFPSSYSRASALCQLTGHGSCGFNQTDFIQIKDTSFFDHATGGNSCSQFKHDYTIGGIPSRNVWHRLVVHKLWKGDNTGVLEIWLDGSKKDSASGIPTAYSDATSSYAWHVGVYAGFNSGSAGTRTVYTDHARIATSYSEAEPANW
jgi:Polysaccharide lyase